MAALTSSVFDDRDVAPFETVDAGLFDGQQAIIVLDLVAKAGVPGIAGRRRGC